LNFVKEIAALHHGRVELQNLPERGLSARFEIAAT
jgi:signal transduction histidine kinase